MAAVYSKISNDLKESYNQGGIEGLKSAFDANLNSWKSIKVNIAVTGQSGSGKSSFINALRNLNGDQQGAAPVGVKETTMKCSCFPHPNNPNFLVWDLPGVGTTNFPKDTYFKKVSFDLYDFFIIITSKRVTENDVWLASQIEKKRKRFYFVRAKFESDINNMMKMNRKKKKYTKEELEKLRSDVYKEVYDDCRDQLKLLENKENIFIIDSHAKSQDFEKLKEKMVSDSVQKEPLIFTLTAVTTEAILEKKRILEALIPKKALMAALAPAFYQTDVNILLKEQEFYRKQFGIDVDTLAKDTRASRSEEQLYEFMEKAQSAVDNAKTSKWLVQMKGTIPFLPFVFNQIRAYGFSKKWLKEALNSVVDSALAVHKDMATGLVSDSNVVDIKNTEI